MNPEVHVQIVEQMEGDYLYEQARGCPPFYTTTGLYSKAVHTIIHQLESMMDNQKAKWILKPIMSNRYQTVGKNMIEYHLVLYYKPTQ